MDDAARALVKNISQVYSLPTIYYKLDQAIANPNSSTSQIADIIRDDTGLAARVLKLANSAFYSFPGKVDSITKAITIIGTRQLRDIVLATTVIKLFNGIPENVVSMQEFWKHSIACGLCARIFAAEMHESNLETYFVAGVLHDIGSLILYVKKPTESAQSIELTKKEQRSTFDAEQKVFGFDHATVGGYLLEEWKLPSILINAAKYHHRPQSAGKTSSIAAVIHVSDIVVLALEYGNRSAMVPALVADAWQQMGLSETALQRAAKMLDEQFSEVADIFLQD